MISSPVALVRIAVLSTSALPPLVLVKASRMPPRSWVQLEGEDPLGGVVGGPVVHHDDLQRLVVHLEQVSRVRSITAPSLCMGTTRVTDGR